MFGFKKKDKPPKDTNSPEFRLYMCKKLDGMSLKYVLERDPEKLTAAYNQGRETALRHLEELKEFLLDTTEITTLNS